MRKKELILLIWFLMLITSATGQVEKIWETDTHFKLPESVAFDKKRNVLYVSNYIRNPEDGLPYGDGFISKAKKNGDLIELVWIGNLTSPTGIAVIDDALYIVERFGIIVYDLEKNAITHKYLIQNTKFLNDITIGSDTSIFVTDSESNVIYKIKNGKVEKWLESNLIEKTNGILYDEGRLILGVNSDGYLKAVDIKTKAISKIAFLGEGEMDGIKKIKNDYLVSLYAGSLYRIRNNGKTTELLNTREKKIQCADFEYIPEEDLLIVPALRKSQLFGYRLQEDK